MKKELKDLAKRQEADIKMDKKVLSELKKDVKADMKIVGGLKSYNPGVSGMRAADIKKGSRKK